MCKSSSLTLPLLLDDTNVGPIEPEWDGCPVISSIPAPGCLIVPPSHASEWPLIITCLSLHRRRRLLIS